MKPIRLEANQLHRFYRGGEAIARFRGIVSPGEYAPEDWVGSTATIFQEDVRGLSVLADGHVLRDAITQNREEFLGSAHAARYGPDPMLLVKLLDAGERLPVHCHPDRDFAQRHLGLRHGKTEAWLIVEVQGEDASVHLGFREDVDADTVAGWVERQEHGNLLGALNEVRVSPGDCVFVPAGLPHSIGKGIFLVELQEPSDLSVLLEWTGYAVDGTREGHLGIGFDLALGCLAVGAVRSDTLDRLKRATSGIREVRPGVRSLLSSEADPYFRAERLQPDSGVSLEPSFSILVILEGEGQLETERDGALALARGQTVLVPYAAGVAKLTGAIEVVRCLPPRSE